MKAKMIGFAILVLVILAGGGYSLYQNRITVTEINGYLGGEKIGLIEDEEIKSILKKKYHLEIDYSRAGSLDMVTADLTGRDYLFPSSQTALAYYQELYGKALSDEIMFNTPIVLYSYQIVADAMEKEGIITKTDGVYYADMQKLTELMMAEKTWSDIGLPQLYGPIIVDTTDPTKSNSGNMYAALTANMLNNGKTVDLNSVDEVIPKLRVLFSRLGYMETSSSDLFNQFLRMGVGAKPMIAGYENQLLEFATQNPEDYENLKDDIVIIYPPPTVWSTHIYIALNDEGKKGYEALSDAEVQRLAWEKHGFRTGNNDAAMETGDMKVQGIPAQITGVMNMPDYQVMKKIIDSLE